MSFQTNPEGSRREHQSDPSASRLPASGRLITSERPAAAWSEEIFGSGKRENEVYPAQAGDERCWCLKQTWKVRAPLSAQLPESETRLLSFEEGLTYMIRRNQFAPFFGGAETKASYAEQRTLGRVSGSGEYFRAETEELLVGDLEVASWTESLEGEKPIERSLKPAQLCGYQGWLASHRPAGTDRGYEESFITFEQGLLQISALGALDKLFEVSAA